MGELIYRTAALVERADTKENEFVFQISDETVDRHGTVFTADGWDFTSFRQNPIVTYQHTAGSENPDDIIGRATDIWQEGGKTFSRVVLESEEINPKAEKVRKKLINKTLSMASVGAIVSDYRFGDKEKGEDPDIVYFTRQELVEWSIVSAGSNRNATVQRNAEALDNILKDLKKENPEFDPGENERLKLRMLINKNSRK